MKRVLGSLALVASLCLVSAAVEAQQTTAGKGEKVCRTKFKYTGVSKTWVCKKEELCCVWHEINYVKCGAPGLNCL